MCVCVCARVICAVCCACAFVCVQVAIVMSRDVGNLARKRSKVVFMVSHGRMAMRRFPYNIYAWLSQVCSRAHPKATHASYSLLLYTTARQQSFCTCGAENSGGKGSLELQGRARGA